LFFFSLIKEEKYKVYKALGMMYILADMSVLSFCPSMRVKNCIQHVLLLVCMYICL